MESNGHYTDSSSSLVNIYGNQIDANDGWDENEEIELGSEEHHLFLNDNYIKTSNDVILPIRAPPSPAGHRNGFTGDYTNNKKQQSYKMSTRDPHPNGATAKGEPFQVDDSGRGSPTASSVVYQTPNYDQFAGNLAPSSSTSVLISLVIIIVILSVTIVPMIMPQAFSSDESSEDSIERNHSIAQAQIIHSDVRCKCICPPFPHSNKNSSSHGALDQTSNRRLYVGNTTPDQCNCDNIVQPHFKTDTQVLLSDFCTRCECRYQSRSTTTIKRNVIFFIAVLTGLASYMLIQYLLKYFKITRRSLPGQLRWLSHQMTEG